MTGRPPESVLPSTKCKPVTRDGAHVCIFCTYVFVCCAMGVRAATMWPLLVRTISYTEHRSSANRISHKARPRKYKTHTHTHVFLCTIYMYIMIFGMSSCDDVTLYCCRPADDRLSRAHANLPCANTAQMTASTTRDPVKKKTK